MVKTIWKMLLTLLKRLKKIADKKADKNAKKVQKALETWNATSITDIKYSSSDILSRDRQRLQEKKIEFY